MKTVRPSVVHRIANSWTKKKKTFLKMYRAYSTFVTDVSNSLGNVRLSLFFLSVYQQSNFYCVHHSDHVKHLFQLANDHIIEETLTCTISPLILMIIAVSCFRSSLAYRVEVCSIFEERNKIYRT